MAPSNIQYDNSRRQTQNTGRRDRQELRDVTYSRGIADDTGNIEITRSNNDVIASRDENVVVNGEDRLVSVLQTFAWRLTNYTECTRKCGGGMSTCLRIH